MRNIEYTADLSNSKISEAQQIELIYEESPLYFYASLENRDNFLIRLEVAIEHQEHVGKYCIQYLNRKLTLREATLRLENLSSLNKEEMNEQEVSEWVELLEKPTRREGRRRKNAKPHLRLKEYLKKILKQRNKQGAWTYCPSYKDLAEALELSESTISRALKKLEGDSDLSFKSGYPEGIKPEPNRKRRRVKFVCLRSYLQYDELPLMYDKDGRERHIRDNFRKDTEKLAPAKPFEQILPKNEKDLDRDLEQEEIEEGEEGINCQKCLPDPIRLSNKLERQLFTTKADKSASPKKYNLPNGRERMKRYSYHLGREHAERYFNDSEESRQFYLFVWKANELQKIYLYALKRGYLLSDIEAVLYSTHQKTQTALHDTQSFQYGDSLNVRNWKKYWWGIFKNTLEEKNASPQKCHAKAKSYWQENLPNVLSKEGREMTIGVSLSLGQSEDQAMKKIAKHEAIAEHYKIAL